MNLTVIMRHMVVVAGTFLAGNALAADVLWNGVCEGGLMTVAGASCSAESPCTVKVQSGESVSDFGVIASESAHVMVILPAGELTVWAAKAGVAVTETQEITCQ